MTFFKPIMGNQQGTCNGSVYVDMIESGRISLYDHVMDLYVQLTENNEMVNYKISFIALIIVLYHY